MGPSDRTSQVICLLVIIGVSWGAYEVSLPLNHLPSPLLTTAAQAESAALPPAVAQTSSAPLPLASSARDGFEFANAFETEADTQRLASDSLALAPTALPPETAPQRSLPPLVPTRPEPEQPVLAMNTADELLQPEGAAALNLTALSGPSMLAAASEAVRDETATGAADESGSGPDILAAAGDTPAERTASPAQPRRYVVKRGDTPTEIALRAYGAGNVQEGLRAMAAANPKLKRRPDRIVVGQELILPELAAAVPKRGGRGRGASRPAGLLIAQVDEPEPQQTAEPRWYTIREDDSLTTIARRQLNDGRRWREIQKLNSIRDANKIIPGTRIMLPPVNG